MSITGSGPEFARRVLAAVNAARADTVAGAGRSAGTGQPVRISGRATPGRQGVLTAPISGKPCVWYRAVTSPFKDPTGTVGLRRYEAKVPGYLPSSSAPPTRMSARRRDRQQIDDSNAPFLIVDGAARIEIDPDEAIIDSEVATTNELRRDSSGRATALQQEWIIPPDEQLLAYGVPVRNQLSADPSNPADPRSIRLTSSGPLSLIVTTHDERFVEGHASATLRLGWLARPKLIAWTVGGFLLAALVIGCTLTVLAITGVI